MRIALAVIALLMLVASCGGGGGKVNPSMNPEKIDIGQTHGPVVENSYGRIEVTAYFNDEHQLWVVPIEVYAKNNVLTAFRCIVNMYDDDGRYLDAGETCLLYDPEDENNVWPNRTYTYYVNAHGPEASGCNPRITLYYIGPDRNFGM